MRILWHGIKAQLKTGYGNQSKVFIPALEDLGHEVAINSMIDQYQTGMDDQGVINFATGPNAHLMGNDFFLAHVDRYKPDIVISMCDPFTCKPELFEKVSWYPFVMVDSEPLSWWNAEVLKACIRPIAPSLHAKQVLSDAGFDPIYIPLAIDTEVFKPQDRAMSRAAMSEIWGVNLNNCFVAVMNSANHSCPSRKNFSAALKAWSMFEKRHKNCMLYIHADMHGMVYKGEDLIRVKEFYGAKNVIFAPQYEYNTGMIGQDYLAKMYSAADVFLHTARGEGFGLPIVEAQACGCPVIVPNFGSMQELCFKGSACQGMKFMHQAGSEQFLVYPESVATVLESYARVVDNRVIPQEVANYDIQSVSKNYLKPALDEIEEAEIERKEEKSSGACDRSRMHSHAACN